VIKEMNELKGAAVSMMDGRMDDALPITPILFFFPTNKKKKAAVSSCLEICRDPLTWISHLCHCMRHCCRCFSVVHCSSFPANPMNLNLKDDTA
jgi:hypothetical protein